MPDSPGSVAGGKLPKQTHPSPLTAWETQNIGILLNNGFMLFALVATAIAFLAYSAFTVRKRGAKAYFGQLGRGVVPLFVLLGKFLIKAIGLLAQSARTGKFGKESDIAPSGGVLNYRKGKLDNGTDPLGWYEKD